MWWWLNPTHLEPSSLKSLYKKLEMVFGLSIRNNRVKMFTYLPPNLHFEERVVLTVVHQHPDIRLESSPSVRSPLRTLERFHGRPESLITLTL